MIPILHDEQHFMLVSKPAGLLTQAVEGIESLQSLLEAQIKARDCHAGVPFVGLPHRLDRGTSGVVLVARNQRALKRFGTQFQHRLVQKYYLAWVEGDLTGPVQRWSDYVTKVKDEPRGQIVAAGSDGARLAELTIRPMVSSNGHSLALIHLLTGRMHQIRLQLSQRGWPVAGDWLYGATSSVGHLCERPLHWAEAKFDEVQSQNLNQRRQQPLGLHAVRIEFRHPQSAVHTSGTAPVPEYWRLAGDPLWRTSQAIEQLSRQSASELWNIETLELPG
ncbi:MAG: RNA pseudouridine synthase [Pirellulaceae bacterium]|nr:RNA pseudouridine synthase [Pirellulaceae bacterium]